MTFDLRHAIQNLIPEVLVTRTSVYLQKKYAASDWLMRNKSEGNLSKNVNRHVITASPALLMICAGEYPFLGEVSNMNNQRATLTLLLIAVSCCVGVPIASSQNLTDQWVEQAARPLVENRVADGLSVGYIEGQHYGIVHLGSSNRAGKKADNLTVYEIGSVSKVFTSLLLADAVVRGEIDLNAAADVANGAGIRLPSRDGTSIKWIDLSTHRTGLPKLPGNLPLTNPTESVSRLRFEKGSGVSEPIRAAA